MSQVTWREILIYGGLPVLGAIALHLWNRYRQRLVALRWTAHYQRLAFAADDQGWGHVELLYNGTPTQNLQAIRVNVQNDSGKDLQNVEIEIHADDGTVVLRSVGQLRTSKKYVPFGQDYAAVLQRAGAGPLPPAELDYWMKRSDFLIPVLNRNEIVEFSLLVARSDYLNSTVTLACDHVGVKLVRKPLAQETAGVPHRQAQIAGIITSLIVAAIFVRTGLGSWVVVSASWTVGAFAIVLGIAVVRAWRLVKKLAD